jgi:hypothetical protein
MDVPDVPDDEKIANELPEFDPDNPRLVEDVIRRPSDTQVIRSLAETADLQEVLESIASNGYFDIEPLIVQRVQDKFRILAGNAPRQAMRTLSNEIL